MMSYHVTSSTRGTGRDLRYTLNLFARGTELDVITLIDDLEIAAADAIDEARTARLLRIREAIIDTVGLVRKE